MKLQVTIPCYNEEKNIPLILERFQTILNRKDVGLLLVDNGSKDNTSSLLSEILPKYKFASSIQKTSSVFANSPKVQVLLLPIAFRNWSVASKSWALSVATSIQILQVVIGQIHR